MIGSKLRRLGKAGAISGFGLLVFAIVFYVSLPYDRFEDYLANRVALYGYTMEAGHAGPSLSLGMTLDDVSLVSRPTGKDKPTRVLAERVTLGWSLLSSLFGTNAYSLSAKVFGGEIDGKVRIADPETSLRMKGRGIQLAEIPWVKSSINLPAGGALDWTMDLSFPEKRPSQAKGLLSWSCQACFIGDGKAKLIVRNNPLLADGLGLPRIRLGDFQGKVVIDKGVGRLQNVGFQSQDLEATIDGEIHLAQPITRSRVDLYIRFKPSDSLLRSSEKLRTIMDLTAQAGKRPDGFLGLRVTGSFQRLNSPQWVKISPFAGTHAASKPAAPAHLALPPHPTAAVRLPPRHLPSHPVPPPPPPTPPSPDPPTPPPAPPPPPHPGTAQPAPTSAPPSPPPEPPAEGAAGPAHRSTEPFPPSHDAHGGRSPRG